MSSPTRWPLISSRLISSCLVTSAACLLLLTHADVASAAQVDAASCAQADVIAAIDQAVDGDTVTIPSGTCHWDSGMTLTKGIHLRGSSSESVTVTMGGTWEIVKNSTHSVELSSISFEEAGAGTMFRVTGEWSAEPPLIHDNTFTVAGAQIFHYVSNGGIIYRNAFNGEWDDSGIQHKDSSDTQSWTTAATMGIDDSDGRSNLYVEDNVFNGMQNQCTDFDDASRVVFRFNTLNHSSFNSHGLGTSPVGVRHFEIYGNEFLCTDDSINQNWQIWLRGGTGVIYDNVIQDIVGPEWGDKTELLLSVRAIHDNQCCTSYPCAHQIGQSHDGSTAITDPLHVWGNTGTWAWGFNTWDDGCGTAQQIEDYIEEGRDIVLDEKPGYAPYAYPHPLRNDASGGSGNGGSGNGGSGNGEGGDDVGPGSDGGGTASGDDGPLDSAGDGGGCSCRSARAPTGFASVFWLTLLGACLSLRRRPQYTSR